MNIAGIRSADSGISVKQSSRDSYEINIKKQIHTLEEEIKTISNDDQKPAEQKAKEKQAAQEQLQNLNMELREYQIRKQQEETAKKQAAIKEALAPSAQTLEGTVSIGLNTAETGVMISLSQAHEQMSGMVRLRHNLEGKQRTAETEEEKEELQKKIDTLSGRIGTKMSAAVNTISDHRKNLQKDDTPKQSKAEYEKEEVFWTDLKPLDKNKPAAAADKPLLNSRNRPFDDISFSIK